jgi:peroxiredoxin
MRPPSRSAAFLALALALPLGSALAPRTARAVEEGEMPPALDVADWVGGGPIELPKQEGKVVAIVFFSLDSPELEGYFQKYNTVVEAYAKSGLVFFGLTRDWKAAVVDQAPRHKAAFPIACDDAQKSWKAWGIRSYPWAFVLNIYGEVQWQGNAFDVGAFVPAIEAALKDIKTISVARADTSHRFEKVWKAIDKADFRAAIKLLVTLSHSDDERDKAHGTQMLKDLETIASQRLARADELAKRRDYGAAVRVVQSIVKMFEGLPQAKAAKEKYDGWLKDPAAKREIEAMNAFLAAKALEDGNDSSHAVERYQQIIATPQWRGTKGQIRAQERLDDIMAKRKKRN